MTAWLALASERQRDHARNKYIAAFVKVLKEHEPSSGIAYRREQQLLDTDPSRLGNPGRSRAN